MPESPFPYDGLLDFGGLKMPGKTPVFLFDSGSHMGFSLPDTSSHALRGAFFGPWLLAASDRLLARSLVRPLLSVDGEAVDLATWEWRGSSSPGLLSQSLSHDGLGFEVELLFLDSQAAVHRWRLANRSDRTVKVDLEIQALAGRLARVEEDGCLSWKAGRRGYPERVVVAAPGKGFGRRGRGGFAAFAEGALLASGATLTAAVLVFHEFPRGRRWEEAAREAAVALRDPGSLVPASAARYAELSAKVEAALPAEADRRLAMKCLTVLETNRKAPAGDLRHEGIYPDSGFFKAFWGWDSWKHSYALAALDPGLAKSGFLAMYDFMDEDGMVPDNAFPVRSKNNLRDSKPPLSGWAAWRIVRATGDRGFAEQAYRLVGRQHRWWYAFRDHDHNGLCEFGSTDGYLQPAKWESGMDNAARFDGRKCVRNAPGAWSCDLESVDLNSFLYLEKTCLAELAGFLGLGREAEAWRAEAAALRDLANAVFFDESRGYYHDVDLATKRHVPQAGCEGWIPLFAGMADKARARSVRDRMMDPAMFNTFVPLPSLAASDPAFMRGESYWRGRVWVDQAWFGIAGLRRYGYTAEAAEFGRRLLANCAGLREFPGNLRENYSPVDGSGMGSGFFSWTAASVLMLLLEEGCAAPA